MIDGFHLAGFVRFMDSEEYPSIYDGLPLKKVVEFGVSKRQTLLYWSTLHYLHIDIR